MNTVRSFPIPTIDPGPLVTPELALLGLVGLLALISLVQFVVLLRIGRRVRSGDVVIERLNERLTHFAQALSLLTDTTEQGLENVAAGLTALGRKVATRSSTRATGRRIADAVRGGRSLAAIAAAELMSESEVRLHVGLEGAQTRTRATTPGRAAHDPSPREENAWLAASTLR